MITYKLKIKNQIDIITYMQNYSYAFRKLYVNFDNADKEYIQKKFELDVLEFRSLYNDVQTKLAQSEANTKSQLLGNKLPSM